MPALGIILILIGVWVIMRTLAGKPSLAQAFSRGSHG